MRPALFQRWFSILACLAMLLVVAAPLVSREMNHPAPGPMSTDAHAGHGGHSPPAASDPHAMHHGHGAMEHMAMAALPAPDADPHKGHDMGVDCEYCPIAARMLGFAVLVLLALFALPAAQPVGTPAIAWRSTARSRHLGARGPPLAA